MEYYFASTPQDTDVSESIHASPFTIKIVFESGLTDSQKKLFANAADRWCKIITSDLPTVVVDEEEISGIKIVARSEKIDGQRQVLAKSGPVFWRPKEAGKYAFLPATGVMNFDTDDLRYMERAGTLSDVITHEMGHTLGFGMIWNIKRLTTETNGLTFYSGPEASLQYGLLMNQGPLDVPLETKGGAGSADCHWDRNLFKKELMCSGIRMPGNPISKVTVGCLQDMGYDVNMEAADAVWMKNTEGHMRPPPGTFRYKMEDVNFQVLPEDMLLKTPLNLSKISNL